MPPHGVRLKADGISASTTGPPRRVRLAKRLLENPGSCQGPGAPPRQVVDRALRSKDLFLFPPEPPFHLAHLASGLWFGYHAAHERAIRSEERRVGKECRSRWSPEH